MAFAYSVRFRRWSSGWPGFGFAAAAWSRRVSIHVAVWVYVASSGRGKPGGGMARMRNLRTTFSQVAGSELTVVVFSTSPATRARWL